MKSISTIVILIISSFLYTIAQGHKIEVKIKNLSNSKIYLGYYYGAKKYVIDTLLLDKNGKGIFENKKNLDQGVYLIFLESKKYFEFLIPENQHFYIETDTLDLNRNLVFKNSDENAKFNLYQKQVYSMQLEMNRIINEARQSKSEEKNDSLKNIAISIQENIKSFWKNSADINKTTLLGVLIKSMIEVEIPNTIDSTMHRIYSKYHYFDNIDLNDSRLLRSPILHNKIDIFFNEFVEQNTDSMISATEFTLSKSSKNTEIYKYILVYLLRYYESSHNVFLDDFYIYISEKYFITRTDLWTDVYLIESLKSKLSFIKPTIVGAVAPEVELLNIKGNTFSTHFSNKKYTILYFWDPECEHCDIETSGFYSLYKKLPKNDYEFIAIYISNNYKVWNNYIIANNFTEWINAYSPHNFSSIKESYNLFATPLAILVDKDKKIIGKFIEAKELLHYLKL